MKAAGVALALVLCATAGPAAAAEPLVTDALTECNVPGIRNSVLCGVIKRPLDPARPDGVKVDIHYVVAPALARRKLPDPVFMLAGGPGQSAISLAPSVLALFSRLNNRRDIVFVDQRGTGASAPLVCEDTRRGPLAEQADPERQVADLLACRVRLQALPYGDLRFFTTVLASQDLDAVRLQLGAERINLIGGSYGTRAALDYLRQFPGAVRRSVIDGVAPPDMVLPASFSTDGQSALDAVFTACESEAACKQAWPTLRTEWASLLASLPLPTTVAHPLTGAPERVHMTRDMVLASVRGPLYSPAMAAALPAAIHAAAQGRFEALLGLGASLGSGRGGQVAMGMHFSVICSEDVPLLTKTMDLPGADFGRAGARLYEQVCAQWPHGSVPPAFYSVPASTAPTLVLSGGLDPATPPRHGDRIARALGPTAQHVVVPNAGHGVMGIGCVRDVIYRFIDATEDSAATRVDAGCVKAIPRPAAFRPLSAGVSSTSPP
jgi:pimeloyl-ACP methyl ester carboxylesterase